MDNILRILLKILIWITVVAKLKEERGWADMIFTAITAGCLCGYIDSL